MIKEEVGIRDISRLLSISKNTVLSRIKSIASTVNEPEIESTDSIYEVNEMWTFNKSKENVLWITYIYVRVGKSVIDFVVEKEVDLF